MINCTITATSLPVSKQCAGWLVFLTLSAYGGFISLDSEQQCPTVMSLDADWPGEPIHHIFICSAMPWQSLILLYSCPNYTKQIRYIMLLNVHGGFTK